MKSYFLIIFSIIAVSAASLEELRANQFQEFKLQHHKFYKNQVEETTRYSIFLENLKIIEAHNALFENGLVTYKKGINKFADWTTEEFEDYLTIDNPPPLTDSGKKFVKSGIKVPSSVDWRSEGYVTRVKDQGQCGSCWAFSVTGTVEGAYFKATGELVTLSEQDLVDCTTGINNGCRGGWMEKTLIWIKENGIERESDYPYTGKDETCKHNNTEFLVEIEDVVTFQKDEKALLEATATIGPISIYINAASLHSYASGIITNSINCDISNLNHGVLVVGYGSENGQDYWIVKNSWGESWGEKGYFRIDRGTNECGLAERAEYATVKIL